MPRKAVIPNINRWVAEHYGSRRGFVLTWWHRARYLFVGYRGYRRVDWKTVDRLVFVCKGNICRSAFAEAVARSQGIEAVSCGLETRLGLPANENAIRAAAKNDISLNEHQTTPLHKVALRKNDLLIAMEPWQAERLERELSQEYACTLLGVCGDFITPHIHDPYGGTEAYFDNCFDYIEKSVHEITIKLAKTNRH